MYSIHNMYWADITNWIFYSLRQLRLSNLELFLDRIDAKPMSLKDDLRVF
jgi:hypothetical protein